MKVLIVFNHPAPYKVKLFNILSNEIDLFVIFERKFAKDRPEAFYTETNFNFPNEVYDKGYIGKENSFTCKLKNYIKKNHKNYDLIVMNGYSTFSEQLAINYMIKNKIPYILFINGGVIREGESRIKRALKRRYITNAAGYLSPNKQASLFLTYYGAKKTIIEYPYCTYFENNVKKPNLSVKERNSLREKYKIPQGKVFISASNFIPRKNNFQLFDSFKDSEYLLILYGNGPLKKEYENYLQENGIKNVIIRPFVASDTLIEIMSCCDCFITLSKEDIYGHTTLEALAAGIPVISSERVVSSIAVVKDWENGFIVSNSKQIKEAMENVNYENMSAKCIETAKQFSIEKEADAIIKGLGGFVE